MSGAKLGACCLKRFSGCRIERAQHPHFLRVAHRRRGGAVQDLARGQHVALDRRACFVNLHQVLGGDLAGLRRIDRGHGGGNMAGYGNVAQTGLVEHGAP